MKKTASFFFLGTNCHHSTYQDALTEFHNATALQANQPGSTVVTHLFDGVGSDPGHMADTHPTPGRYVYDAVRNLKIRAEDELLDDVKDIMQRVTGCLAGEGIDDLVFEATLFLRQLIEDNGGEMPETVNLHGYSRGADTCVRLANLLDRLYPEVKVNLFLIDQVPGPRRIDDPDSYIIPKNVQRLDAAIMLHEYKPGFDPQDRSRYVFASPCTTKVAIKVYPGNHGQAVLQTNDENTNHVAKLLHDDFYRFCQETGSLSVNAPVPPYKIRHTWTSYSDRPAAVLTKETRFDYYNQMQENWWLYSKGTAINKRSVLNNHRHYSLDKRLFVNQEHGELFQALYPNLYQWFYEGKAVDTEDLRGELERLEIEHPEFYEKFCRINAIKADTVLPNPQKRTLYFRRRLGETLVDDERSFLENALISVIHYERYHNEQKSETVARTIKYLQRCLRDTEDKSDELSCDFLKQAIAKAARHLSASGKQESYLYRQLSKVCHSVQYIDNVSRLLDEWLVNSSKLHLKQLHYIRSLKTELAEINDDKTKSYVDKLSDAKSKVSSFVLNLNEWDDSSNLIPLLKGLNELNAPGFSETSLASDIAKNFKAYYLRNMFWDSVHKLLSHLIDLPPFFSSKKSDVAQKIYEELDRLEESGGGNDLAAISKVLAAGQREIQADYQEGGKPDLGDFDKIMNKAHAQLSLEINAFPFYEASDLGLLAPSY